MDVVVTREPLTGRGPAHVLGEAGVEVRTSDATTLAEVFGAVGPKGVAEPGQV